MPRYTDPRVAAKLMREKGVTPLSAFPGANVKWKCRCKKCLAIVYPRYSTVKSQGTQPCQKCAAVEMGERKRKKFEKKNVAIMQKAGLQPLTPYPGSHTPWLSRCLKCRKEVKPHFTSVVNGGSCAYCSGRRVDERDVRTAFKKAGFLPIGPFPGPGEKWKSRHKPCNKIVLASYALVKLGRGCAVCSGNARVLEADARKLFLKNKLKPLVPFVNTQQPWKSQCLKCGKEVQPNYSKVLARGHQCSYCAGTRVDEQDAIALLRRAKLVPLESYPGGNTLWKVRCRGCKHELDIRYSSIRQGHGCKFCTGKEVHPNDAKDSIVRRGYEPLTPYPGASTLWKVRCTTCKRVQEIKMHSLNSNKRCVYCARRKLDLDDVYKRVRELDFQPLEKFKNATTPWKIKCLRCQHVIYPTWDRMNRRDRNRGCGYCVEVRVDIKDVSKLMRQLKLKPLVKYPGGKTSWKCKCLKCASIVYPRYNDLRQGQGGCSNCADYGLNYTDKGYIYLITHPLLNAHKIGIANKDKGRPVDDRMYKHKKAGWKLYKRMEFSRLEKAHRIEQEVLKWLRIEVGMPIHLGSVQMPQGGWTETVNALEIDLQSIWAKVEELSRKRKR